MLYEVITETSARARAIADAVERVATTLAEADMDRLYAVAREEALITAGDAIVDELRKREGIDAERLWAIGKWLVETRITSYNVCYTKLLRSASAFGAADIPCLFSACLTTASASELPSSGVRQGRKPSFS